MERQNGLVKSNYKELTDGEFDDCTKDVLADLQAADNSESE